MKVGDYVRTDRGYITKISDFKEHYTKGKRLGLKEEVVENFLLLDDKQCEIIESIDYSIPPCYPSDEELEKIKSHIIKSSSNIIDLLEVGDYVNGLPVMKIEINEDGERNIYVGEENTTFGWLVYYDIKSIVTKEQFEAIKYEIK